MTELAERNPVEELQLCEVALQLLLQPRELRIELRLLPLAHLCRQLRDEPSDLLFALLERANGVLEQLELELSALPIRLPQREGIE